MNKSYSLSFIKMLIILTIKFMTKHFFIYKGYQKQCYAGCFSVSINVNQLVAKDVCYFCFNDKINTYFYCKKDNMKIIIVPTRHQIF